MFYCSGKHAEAAGDHRSGCYCRVCLADLELVGRLMGTETHAMQSLSQNTVFRMLAYFTEVAEAGPSSASYPIGSLDGELCEPNHTCTAAAVPMVTPGAGKMLEPCK